MIMRAGKHDDEGAQAAQLGGLGGLGGADEEEELMRS